MSEALGLVFVLIVAGLALYADWRINLRTPPPGPLPISKNENGEGGRRTDGDADEYGNCIRRDCLGDCGLDDSRGEGSWRLL